MIASTDLNAGEQTNNITRADQQNKNPVLRATWSKEMHRFDYCLKYVYMMSQFYSYTLLYIR